MLDKNYRKVIINEIIQFAEKDTSIVLLVGDMGFGAINKFQERFPNRTFNLGMMEQGMVGVAAGMAMSGLKPIVYTMVNFLAFRALEQIRNDVVIQDLNVKFIGTGANDYFHFLGVSHCCGNDDIKAMNLIDMPVLDPYSEEDCNFKAMISKWINSEKASYIRV